MKSLEIVAFNRNPESKALLRQIRAEGNVPCVLYSKKSLKHFSVPAILFRDLVYTPNTYIVDLNVEGEHFKCILKDVQFHPVSEVILHADFYEIAEDEKVKIDVPLKFVGNAVGVIKGGKLVPKIRKVTLRSFPKDLPDYVEVNVTNLELGKSLKVNEIAAENFEILNAPKLPVVSVDIPRALKGKTQEEEEAAEA